MTDLVVLALALALGAIAYGLTRVAEELQRANKDGVRLRCDVIRVDVVRHEHTWREPREPWQGDGA